MRTMLFASAAIACLLLGNGCTKDQDDAGYRAAKITFATGSGYTYKNDTFPAGDTIRIGVTVQEGSKQLRTFLVHRSYNGGPAQRMDSLPIHTMPFRYDTLYALRHQPGTEQWTFSAVEGNGDLTKRSLTFTTQ